MGAELWPLQDAPNGQDAVLRIHAPGGSTGDGEPSLDWTLGEFYRRYYEPVLLVMKDARPRNLEEIRRSVAYWKAFTGDPRLGAITRYHARDFVVGLKSLPGRKYPTIGNNTVRKHCGAVQAILDFCGPPDRKHRESLGLFASQAAVPFIPRPQQEQPSAEDSFTFEEVQLLVDHASAARLPDGLPCSAEAYMRRLYVLLYNTTVRISGVMGATWRHYHGDHLILPARIVAKGRHAKRIELNDAARAVIESMRGCDCERIFPWPLSWPSSRQQLYRQHALIRTCLPRHRQFAFHAVRKLSNLEIARINPKACEKALGNSGRVNVEHYTSRQLVSETLAKLPALRTSRDRQQRLF